MILRIMIWHEYIHDSMGPDSYILTILFNVNS